jgi:hypothetical protein
VTEKILEVEIGGATYRTTYDPRETGTVLFVGFATWTEPPDRPITPADREAILDALWAVAPLTGGARAVVEYVHDAAAYVARRWDRGEDGHMVRVDTTTVEILELQRTAHVPFSPKPGTPPGRNVAVVHAEGAEWVYPDRRAPTPEEGDRIARELCRTQPNDFVMTSFPWTFERSTPASG